MIILVNGGIASGKSTLWQRAPQVLSPILGRVAALDLEELFRMMNPDLVLLDQNWLHDWLLARQHAALLTDSFLTHGFDAVVIAGPFFTYEEIGAYLTWVHATQPIYHFTLRISREEMKRRIVLRGDTEKTEEWIDSYYSRLQAVYQPWMQIIDADACSPEAILRRIGHKVTEGIGRLRPEGTHPRP